jgi:uncharacterized phage protein gp47/JayE
MFEAMTYENILTDMLDRITSDVDKREGSVIYDALAPCAYHLAQNYACMDAFVDLVSGDTAIGEYLDKVVGDYGLTRKDAVYAVRKIVTSGAVDIGTRWGLNGTSYAITALLSTGVYSATCEQLGDTGNQYSGVLENIDNVSGITATLTDIIAAGEEVETDDNLRDRFYARVQFSGTSGNIHDYRNWSLEVPGCGDAKVFPVWDGPGTVKVLVVDEDMTIDTDLPDIVADYIETVRPIGATVTVASPTGKAINVGANIVRDGIKTLAEVQSAFVTVLTKYLNETVFDIYNLSYAKIGSLLLSTPGVSDYSSLTVNSGTVNITIGNTEMPICGTITITEV